MIIALETQSTNHASGKDRIEGTGGTSLVNSNHKGVHMDHIKIMIYGFIGIGVVVSVIALITKMLGIAKY